LFFAKKEDMPRHVPFFYLRLDDFPPEEPDLDPDDLDSLCDELLRTLEPELPDREDEDLIWGALADLEEDDLTWGALTDLDVF
jgi:hypothetical protein